MTEQHFSAVYTALMSNDEPGTVLRAHVASSAEKLAELAPLRKRGPAVLAHSYEMSALSRISDYLIELGYPSTEFHTAIGLTPFDQAGAFSSFHHEIAAVVPDPDATQVTVEDVLWPGFWFGDLLFARAGVRVRAPEELIDPTVACTSTLYFTYRRQPRRTNHPAHDWGSNSRWTIAFDRFYSDDEGLHFNWDGEIDLGDDPPVNPPDKPPHPDGPLDRRRELLAHRCFVRAPMPPGEDDWYPYDGRLSLTSADWPLRPETITHPRWS
ncbi:hypothetical protein [Herbihabitans rhizosphaerae]|uniref:hypothetical protein n=1 Tax=Herbihabitans rhizosphaerae TaxID=1872711 RepID=UPI00102C05BE|nr:hypothetical protein [Herbihabitans rhizosphaerae]